MISGERNHEFIMKGHYKHLCFQAMAVHLISIDVWVGFHEEIHECAILCCHLFKVTVNFEVAVYGNITVFLLFLTSLT